jgi:hypothetical protein
MRTQNISANYAKLFNEALGNLHTHFSGLDSRTQRHLDNLPRVEFIEPMLVEVRDGKKTKCFLIEKLLDGKYEKFNSNNGYICQEAKADNNATEDDLIDNMNNLGLGAIEEGDDEEEESDCEDDEEDIVERLFDEKESVPINGTYKLQELKSSHVPQAFSHFSYVKSRKKLIIVDLQGVLTVTDEGKNMFELTDPVIHNRYKTGKRQ